MKPLAPVVPLFSDKAPTPKKTLHQHLAEAAWHFAGAFGWNKIAISRYKRRNRIRLLSAYFHVAADPKQAFVTFCECMAMIPQCITEETPEDWFIKHPDEGIALIGETYKNIRQTRMLSPDYQKGIRVLSEHYLSYVLEPCKAHFISCEKDLLKLNERDLFQYFCIAIINLQFH